jgi:predicted DNA-binding transcriptional regulator YafY
MAELTSVQRIIRILELLSMGRNLTSSELNRIFDEKVTLRTIQRDMITIQQAGIPLICEKNHKKENVWSFPRDYRRMISN